MLCDIAKGAGKYLKPYQGLKRSDRLPIAHPKKAGKYLKPYQGLKLDTPCTAKIPQRRKIPKTLSGIETRLPSREAISLTPENT